MLGLTEQKRPKQNMRDTSIQFYVADRVSNLIARVRGAAACVSLVTALSVAPVVLADSDGFSDVQGMTGSNVRGMTGSNVRGMTGSNVRGMTGSNVRGMTGSNVRGMTGSNVRSLAGAASDSFGDGFETAAMGVVESVTTPVLGKPVVSVAGVAFEVDASDVGSIGLGDYVVAGSLADGTAAAIYSLGVPYVPGVSPVRLRASVAAVDTSTGTITLGGVTVDYTPELSSNPAFEIGQGDVVDVIGTLPVSGGTLMIGGSGGVSVVESGSLAQ